MDSTSHKRSVSSLDTPNNQDDRAKRQRVSSVEEPEATYECFVESDSESGAVNQPTSEDLGRDGLRRSIALTLEHVGFDSASPEAMESFTAMAETYMERFIGQLKKTAEASRRTEPTPADYETVLQRQNIPLSSLKPHLKNPVPKEKLEPKYYNPFTEHLNNMEKTLSTEFLGPELDGTLDKEARPWIPENLPPFPSKHTYKFTPMEAPVPDQHKKRAEAAASAKKAGEALRRIDRAHNASRHHELKQLAKRNTQSWRRHQALEELMKESLSSDGKQIGAVEIADHSMIVNAGSRYLRQEVPKSAKRNHADGVRSPGVLSSGR